MTPVVSEVKICLGRVWRLSVFGSRKNNRINKIKHVPRTSQDLKTAGGLKNTCLFNYFQNPIAKVRSNLALRIHILFQTKKGDPPKKKPPSSNSHKLGNKELKFSRIKKRTLCTMLCIYWLLGC